METITVKRKITSSHIRISELKRFIGKQVEITVTEKKLKKKKSVLLSAAGILEEFKNHDLAIFENDAWKLAVNEKHGNYGC
jgi:hypothetical protein